MSAGKGDTPRPLSVSRDAFAAAYERTFGKVVAVAKNLRCVKCGETSGNDWSQCRGSCPMPMSPHFTGAKPVGRVEAECTTSPSGLHHGDYGCEWCGKEDV